MSNESNCPVTRWRTLAGYRRDGLIVTGGPHQLDLSLLRQNNPASDPMSKDFDYDEAFDSLDFNALRPRFGRPDD